MKRILYIKIKLKTVSLSHLKSASKSAQEEEKRKEKGLQTTAKKHTKGGHSIRIFNHYLAETESHLHFHFINIL